jgi:hypothetical protein
MSRYDLAVLGGGPGGYVAAIRGSQLGKKVCIIDKEKLGGVYLNWGCIPTKALIKNAEVYNLIKKADKYGVKIREVKVDFKSNVKRSRDVSDRLSKGIEFATTFDVTFEINLYFSNFHTIFISLFYKVVDLSIFYERFGRDATPIQVYATKLFFIDDANFFTKLGTANCCNVPSWTPS